MTRTALAQRPRTLALAAGLLAVLAALVPAPAFAHAGLVSTSPGEGARLTSLPQDVSLTFTEEIATPAYVVVTAADGTTVAQGEPRAEGPVVTQGLTTGPAGAYTMAYRVVSADGHAVTGQVAFGVSEATAPAAQSSQPSSPDEAPGSKAPATPETFASPDASAAPETTQAGASLERGFWARHGTSVLVSLSLGLAVAGLLVARRRA